MALLPSFKLNDAASYARCSEPGHRVDKLTVCNCRKTAFTFDRVLVASYYASKININVC